MKDCAQPLRTSSTVFRRCLTSARRCSCWARCPRRNRARRRFSTGIRRTGFWRVLAALFDEPVPEDNAERADLLLRHHIALWDVLESCDIRGASDASIANPHPNDLSRVLEKAPVRRCSARCSGGALLREAMRGCQWLGRRGAALPEPGQRGLVSAAACGSLSSRSRCDDPL